jgi:hypothetical protein
MGFRTVWLPVFVFRRGLCCAALFVAGATSAASLPAAAKAEVVALLSRLEASGCQFNRNGSWYTGAEARAHLSRKLDYFEGKGSLQTAEQFIEQAASTSSSTGRPYEVRCGGGPAVPSKVWMTDRLKAARAGL